MNRRISRRETATMLAALRYWQREGLMSSGHEQEIATDNGRFRSLSAPAIDLLCERINRYEHTAHVLSDESVEPSENVELEEAAVTIDVSNVRWEDTSLDPNMPGSRLLAAVQVGGVNHHLEAIEVRRGRRKFDQRAACVLCDDILQRYDVVDADSGPFNTVELGGRSYVLFMAPFRY